MPGGAAEGMGGAVAIGVVGAGVPQDPQKELFGSISDPHFAQKAISASFTFMNSIYSSMIPGFSVKSM
jgi:hypothetical protein